MVRIVGMSALLLLALAAPGTAQAVAGAGENDRWKDANWVDDFNFLSANALLGGLTAGVVSKLRKGSFKDGFLDGALGGGVTYLGKRLSAARFSGAGFLGREVAAVGGSIVRNGSLGVGTFDTLVLPLGPLKAFVTPSALRRTRIRLDLYQTGYLLAALSEERLALDWRRTFSAGAPVFLTDAMIQGEDGFVSGTMGGGVIVLGRGTNNAKDDTFAHERVHVAQMDFFEISFGLSLERWARTKVGMGRIPLLDHTVLGVGFYPAYIPLVYLGDYSDRWLEVEAYFLEGR